MSNDTKLSFLGKRRKQAKVILVANDDAKSHFIMICSRIFSLHGGSRSFAILTALKKYSALLIFRKDLNGTTKNKAETHVSFDLIRSVTRYVKCRLLQG